MTTYDDSALGAAGQLTSRTLIGEGRDSNDITVGEESPSMACGLDWLQVTAHADCAPSELLPDCLTVNEYLGADGQGAVPGWIRQLQYDRCCSLLPGGFLMWASANPGQGVHLRLNGSELAALRRVHDFVDEMLFDWVRLMSGEWRVSVTRADLFVDLYGAGCPVEPLARAVLDGRAQSRARFRTEMSEGVHGAAWTVYAGQRKSGKVLRVYDKGREVAAKTGVFDGERTRVEVEFRGEYAGALFGDDVTLAGLAKLVLNTAANMAAFPVPWWVKWVVDGNERRLVRVVHDGEKDTVLWLAKTALPALVRNAGRLDSFELLEPLVQALRQASRGNRKAKRLLSDGLLRSWLLEVVDGAKGGE